MYIMRWVSIGGVGVEVSITPIAVGDVGCAATCILTAAWFAVPCIRAPSHIVCVREVVTCIRAEITINVIICGEDQRATSWWCAASWYAISSRARTVCVVVEVYAHFVVV